MENKGTLSYSDILRHAIAKDILCPIKSGAASSCSVCGAVLSPASDPLVLACRASTCHTGVHAACCLSPSGSPPPLLSCHDGVVSYTCPEHNCSISDSPCNADFVCIITSMQELMETVCPMLEQFMEDASTTISSTVGIEELHSAVDMLNTCMQEQRLTQLCLQETQALLSLWHKRLSSEIEDYTDSVSNILNLGGALNKFKSTFDFESDDSEQLSFITCDQVSSDLTMLLRDLNLAHGSKLGKRVIIFPKAMELLDLESCSRLARGLLDAIAALRALRSPPRATSSFSFSRALNIISEHCNNLQNLNRDSTQHKLSLKLVHVVNFYCAFLNKQQELFLAVDEKCKVFLDANVDSTDDVKGALTAFLTRLKDYQLLVPVEIIFSSVSSLCKSATVLSELQTSLMESVESTDVIHKLVAAAAETEATTFNNSQEEVPLYPLCQKLAHKCKALVSNIRRIVAEFLDSDIYKSVSSILNVHDTNKHIGRSSSEVDQMSSAFSALATFHISCSVSTVLENLIELCRVSGLCDDTLSLTSAASPPVPVPVARVQEMIAELRNAMSRIDKSLLPEYSAPLPRLWRAQAFGILQRIENLEGRASISWKLIDDVISKVSVNATQQNSVMLNQFKDMLAEAISLSVVDITVKTQAEELIAKSELQASWAELAARDLCADGIESVVNNSDYLKLSNIVSSFDCTLLNTSTSAVLYDLFSVATLYRRAISESESLKGGLDPYVLEQLKAMFAVETIANYADLKTFLSSSIHRLSTSLWADQCNSALKVVSVPSVETVSDLLARGRDLYLETTGSHLDDAFSSLSQRFSLTMLSDEFVRIVLQESERLLSDMETMVVEGNSHCGDKYSFIHQHWDHICSCAAIWPGRAMHILSSIDNLILILSSEHVSNDSPVRVSPQLEALLGAQTLLAVVSEACKLLVSLHVFISQNMEATLSSLLPDFCASDLMVDIILAQNRCDQQESFSSKMLSFNFIPRTQYEMTLEGLRTVSNCLENLQLDSVQQCATSVNADINIFLSSLNCIVHDVLVECNAWQETAQKKLAFAGKRRKARLDSLETQGSAITLQRMLQHPFAAVVRMDRREELIQTLLQGQELAQKLRKIIFCNDGDEDGPSALSDREELSFDGRYRSQSSLPQFIQDIRAVIDTFEVFPYFMHEFLVLKWVLSVAIWFHDKFRTCWVKDEEGCAVLTSETSSYLLQLWSRECDFSAGSMCALLQEMGILVDENVSGSVSVHIRTAVSMYQMLSSRVARVQSLSVAAEDLIRSLQGDRDNDKLAALHKLRDEIKSQSVEPEERIMHSIKCALYPPETLTEPRRAIKEEPPSKADHSRPRPLVSGVVKLKRDGLAVDVLQKLAPLKSNGTVYAETQLELLLDGRRQFSTNWLSLVPIKGIGGCSACHHHVDLISLQPMSEEFLNPIKASFGLPINVSRWVSSSLPNTISAAMKEIFLSPLEVAGSNPRSSRHAPEINCLKVLSCLPMCSSSVLSENPTAATVVSDSDGRWDRIRENVRRIYENIFIKAAALKFISSNDPNLNAHVSAAIAKGVVISTEIEEEVHLLHFGSRYMQLSSNINVFIAC